MKHYDAVCFLQGTRIFFIVFFFYCPASHEAEATKWHGQPPLGFLLLCLQIGNGFLARERAGGREVWRSDG